MVDAVRRARMLVLSVGLALWGAGAAVCVWLFFHGPESGAASALALPLITAAMLVALPFDVGLEPGRAERQGRTPDPVAAGVLNLAWYPLFPFIAVVSALDAAGVLADAFANGPVGAGMAVLVFVRGVLHLSPAGARLLAVEIRRPLPAAVTGWLPAAVGGVYALGGAAAFVVFVAGRFWVAVVVLLLTVASPLIANRVARRAEGEDAEAAAASR